jgi:hypothetical protein
MFLPLRYSAILEKQGVIFCKAVTSTPARRLFYQLVFFTGVDEPIGFPLALFYS